MDTPSPFLGLLTPRTFSGFVFRTSVIYSTPTTHPTLSMHKFDMHLNTFFLDPNSGLNQGMIDPLYLPRGVVWTLP